MSFPLSKYNYKWQYNGVAPYHEIYYWCVETFGDKNSGCDSWASLWETMYFVNKEEYEFFLLRWS